MILYELSIFLWVKHISAFCILFMFRHALVCFSFSTQMHKPLHSNILQVNCITLTCSFIVDLIMCKAHIVVNEYHASSSPQNRTSRDTKTIYGWCCTSVRCLLVGCYEEKDVSANLFARVRSERFEDWDNFVFMVMCLTYIWARSACTYTVHPLLTPTRDLDIARSCKQAITIWQWRRCISSGFTWVASNESYIQSLRSGSSSLLSFVTSTSDDQATRYR